VVIEGKTTKEKPRMTENIERQLEEMCLTGAKAKGAIAAVAAHTGLPRKELYKTWLELDRVRGKNKKIRIKTG
jgi:16S rRNA C1402 (ribose-2'-O) methylase RsmI